MHNLFPQFATFLKLVYQKNRAKGNFSPKITTETDKKRKLEKKMT